MADHQGVLRKEGGGIMGAKAQARQEKKRKALEAAIKI
jgi:large subunit ribosomal protein L7Ae